MAEVIESVVAQHPAVPRVIFDDETNLVREARAEDAGKLDSGNYSREELWRILREADVIPEEHEHFLEWVRPNCDV